MAENDPFATLRAPRLAIPWERPEQAPRDAVTERVWIGADPHGLGFEVAVASWSGANPPTQEAMRALHAARLRNRAIPLTVVAHRAGMQAWLFGPLANAPVLGPLPVGQAARIVQAALDEPTAGAARARIIQARDALETADIPGFDSQGLFAIRELTWGVPRRPDWAAASARSRALMATSPRGAALVQGLGFDSRTIPGNALLLSVHGEPPRAVAILLRDDESFDAESARFAKSPIYHGLEIARQNNVRWLLVARGPQLRLYPTAPDIGVGRRGATQTYFGLDLALLDDHHAGYLELAFGAAALAPGGSVDQLLDASRDYAVSLGERLRERIYDEVVDSLSTAIARALATDIPLDDQRLALAYRLTLRILFRLLFQAYAEDTRLLPLHRNERYTRASLKELARDLASHPERPNDPRSTSLWDGLSQVWRVIDAGDEAWGVPAYNGGLFGSDPDLHPEGAAIARLVLHNDAVGPALAGLLVDVAVDGDRGPVDFRSLDVRDFGTIYEGLLESGLSLATEDLVVDASGAWRPARAGERINAATGAPYFHTKSGDRKATGSYFTKPFAVEHLLDRALDPALDTHLEKVAALVGRGDQVGASRLFFDFRVADLAMGSGHFLVSAIGHIEAKFGAFLERNAIPGVERELIELRDAALAALHRVGVEEPEIDRSALLGRQIARRCVYGLDINDIAVELARLAIWVRTFVPGLPMSSLDHQLVCGNSLTGIGTIEEAIEALDPGTGNGALTFSGAAIRTALDHARAVLEDAAALKESTSEEARAAQEASRRALAAAEPAKLLFDAAIAVRLGILAPPSDFDADAIGATASAPLVQRALRRLALTHFPVQFPEVFLREPSGFDVILGNPPWEKLQIEEHSFYALSLPGLRGLDQAAAEKAIGAIRDSRPDLVRAYEAASAAHQATLRVLVTGPYPGLASGRPDLYKAFAWRFMQLLRESGRAGVVMPRKAIEASGMRDWREAAFQECTVTDITVLANDGWWVFDGIDTRTTVVLLSWQAVRSADPSVPVRGPFRSMRELETGRRAEATQLPVAGILAWTTAGAVPLLSDPVESSIYLAMRAAGSLTNAIPGLVVRGLREFNATDDKLLFSFTANDSFWPVYKGESFDLWTPDTGRYYGWIEPRTALRFVLERADNMRRNRRSAFFGQDVRIATEASAHPITRARIAWRDTTNRTNQRTLIAALIPPCVALVHQAYYLFPSHPDPRAEAYLLACLASIPFDWYARRSVETHATVDFVNSAPIPGLTNAPLAARAIEIAGRLAAADARFSTWASAVGVAVGSVANAERPDLIAELDAVVAHLYGLSRQQVEQIFETFHRGWDYADRLARVLAHYDRWASAGR